MASIRRTDIMHNKGFSRGRPAKSERERNRKRQEAYRWRDARRIYLANSFDRWRKLRCSLGMKDSVLAWHLMEAHEKGHCGICKRDMDPDDTEIVPGSQAFFPLLIKAVTNLCHSHFQFDECIKVVGLLCLEFDNARKENFSVDETVLAKSKSQNAGCSGVTVPSNGTESSSRSIESSLKSISESKSSCGSRDTSDKNDSHVLAPVDNNRIETSLPCLDFKSTKLGTNTEDQSVSPHSKLDYPVESNTFGEPAVPKLDPISQREKSCENKISPVSTEQSFCVESEAEVSLEIDVEQIDTSQEENSYHQNESSVFENKTTEVEICYPQAKSPPFRDANLSFIGNSPEELRVSTVSNLPVVESLPVAEEQYRGPAVPDLPLDMSIEKADVGIGRKDEEIRKLAISHPADLTKELSVDISYPDRTIKEEDSNRHINQVKKFPHSMLSQTSGHIKEDAHPSIPWQRRDMSRKEEYEFLEMNPFSDLSEFSQKYPHVHQRTYYRWKRRIKEEYIILEQCPHMTFEQFSSVVLQAKESVFNLWKAFIAQGKGFFAPSDASKRLETKCTASNKAVTTLSDQYSFLQKNLSCTLEQFSQKFSNTTEDAFMALKSKVVQEFWVFYHNQHLDWKEFSKLVDISEEVHNYWRDQLSKDVRPAMSSYSPNAQISPHCPPFQNACDPQAQLLKANIPTYDSTLDDSVSRSLSASYLSSVQNMMFPWASYYGVHGPIGQQILPMMLWPRMMGTNGGGLNPMSLPAIMSSSPSSCGSKSESPNDRNTSTTQSILQPNTSLTDAKVLKGESMKLFPQTKDTDGDCLLGVKRSSSVAMNDAKSAVDFEHCKKQRIKEEMDIINVSSQGSKSRKQNKQEYIYYLKNPTLNFKDLETLFPTISLRTFYRWRKEMNAALLFIQEKSNADYQQFKLVFPDIPENVFELWSAKSSKENVVGRAPLAQNEFRQAETVEHPHPIKGEDDVPMCLKKNLISHQIENRFEEFNMKDNTILGEASPAKKQFRVAHVFIHQNPSIDFTSFSFKFPNISTRSFYRWKKEWKDAIEIIQANPGMNYETYKNIDSSVTEEIYEAWKQYLCGERSTTKVATSDSSCPVEFKVEADMDEYSVKKLSSKEFSYLQLHPEIEYNEFNRIFPYVPNDIFYLWKKEIDKIITYVRTQPSVSFDEISAVLPDVSEEAFHRWKELIAHEQRDASSVERGNIRNENHVLEDVQEASSVSQNNDEDAKAKMTQALLHLMNNPNIEYQVFSNLFHFVSPETFDLWLQRIKTVILHIFSNENLDFEEFRSAFTDIGEDIFKKWRSLTQEQIDAIGNQHVQSSVSEVRENLSTKDSYLERALHFCRENPLVTYEVFAAHYSDVSETDFKCWMLKISTQMSFIRNNKNLIFEDFSGIYPDVDSSIFDLWKNSPTRVEDMPHFLKALATTDAERCNSAISDTITNDLGPSIFPCQNNADNSQLITSESAAVEKDAHQIKYNEGIFENQESSLQKLAELTESNTSYYHGWDSRPDIPNVKDNVLSNGISSEPMTNLSTEYGYGSIQSSKSNAHNFESVGSHLDPSAVDASSVVLPKPVSFSPIPEGLLGKFTNCVEQCGSLSVGQENQSLSALMVMSADRQKFPSNIKTEKGLDSIQHSFPHQGKWKYDSTQASMKDEEEMFSSQRQKKISRAEYLFVKDNPDVDSQEFARIFPGVSARTFYRWKKEIKAQMQVT